jgi:hypothetical protein
MNEKDKDQITRNCNYLRHFHCLHKKLLQNTVLNLALWNWRENPKLKHIERAELLRSTASSVCDFTFRTFSATL